MFRLEYDTYAENRRVGLYFLPRTCTFFNRYVGEHSPPYWGLVEQNLS